MFGFNPTFMAMTFCLAACIVLLPGCSKDANDGTNSASAVGYSFPVKAGKYTVLGILTDGHDLSRAKANAADTLTKYPDIDCMVGLWAYNPPASLSALEDAGKVGEVKIIGFDEDPTTLQAIAEGTVYGTIVQQPFVFGFKSVEYLAAMARGQEVSVPESKKIYVPHMTIKKENVAEFNATIQAIRDGNGRPPEPDRRYDTSEKVHVAFLTNSVDPFWVLAEHGCKLAEPIFNADCTVYMPPNGSTQEQKQFVEDMITRGCQGLAISPIDPKNQVDIINQACANMPVIAQDSDAPESKREFYIGTSNYLAGRAAGKLVKEAVPDGGQVMIFVGKMEVLNAQERSKGVIDELAGKPIPPDFADQAE